MTDDDSAERPTLTGQRLISGRYRLRRVLGRGSMGVVWLAYDEVLHRQVAVKEVQLPDGLPEAEANNVRERTLREARAIAALTHPSVVAVYDVAREGVEPFVVMEWLRGRSLAQVTAEAGTLNTEQAAVVADAVAAALDAAHRRGITHRDVKPGNVLVGEDGQVKLTDFGIARNVSEVTMTSSGLILGTPAYMAPEVAEGRPVTPAADLWSLGATLFSAVEGRPPYDAGDPVATVNEVVHGDVPRVSADTPLADVITGLMAKDPAERMTVMEVRRRIRPLLPDPGSTVFPPDDDPDEDAAGPADDKPTTSLTTPNRPMPSPARPAPPPLAQPAQLAADPGPLPWATPTGPVFGPPPPRPVRRRSPAVTVALVVVGVLLFAAAAGGGFAATRKLAGSPVLPPRAVTATTTVEPQAPPVRSYQRVATQVTTPGVPGGDFSLQVPTGWTEFCEQRTRQSGLPPSAAMHWVKADGTAEITVERFPDYSPRPQRAYTDALQNSDHSGKLYQAGSGAVYEWRTGTTLRTTFFDFVLPSSSADLWVVLVTEPTQQEQDAQNLFDKISPTFQAVDDGEALSVGCPRE
ncbi:MAG TPA: serine/threonine-protein kinase [Pseudonocardiaceae bacterium]|nr:serine/threonine-protein kinase [Pseudonocardiaceae bacterium]